MGWADRISGENNLNFEKGAECGYTALLTVIIDSILANELINNIHSDEKHVFLIIIKS